MDITIPCSECGLLLKDTHSFNVHFRTSHPNVKRFVCKISECSRTYGTFPSFRKHLCVHHKVPSKSSGLFQSTQIDKTKNLNSSLVVNHEDVEASHHLVGNSSQADNSETFKALLVQQQDTLVAKLYANPAFPRNLVDLIVKEFGDYLSSPFFDHLRELITSSLDSNLPPLVRKEIDGMFELLMTPFPHLQTEYKRLLYFEQTGDFIPPVAYKISVREERVRGKDGIKLGMKEVQGQFIPLRQVLTRFFELPNVLADTLEYMKSLQQESGLVTNITQCEVWKQKISKYGKDVLVLPINVYYDECEPNNPLGPHCDPLGCTYVHVATLPPEWSSRLENIFLALLFDADNRTMYGNKEVFKPLISELVFLEQEGIVVNNLKVFFVVGTLLGDNKGLNGICGFVESFSAHHFCRICTCSKEITDHMLVENPAYLRTPENYATDLALNNSQATGLKEECVFNLIPSFVTPRDICVDEFHDVVEGVAHYTMIPVLKHFHLLNKMFIATLNSRLYCINLGPDNDNRPPLVNVERLSNNKLKMTGAEMSSFVRIFGVLVIDMVPNDDQYYKLYLYLHDILCLVHAKALPVHADKIFNATIKDHHQLYLELIKGNLKPKHHNLVHYGNLFRKFGPFLPLSTIRFEAKHHNLVSTAGTCMSRVNLPRTIAIKQQLAFCFRSVSKSSLRQPVVSGPCHLVDLRETAMYAVYSLSLPDSIFQEPIQTLTNWVVYKGTKYEPKQVLLTNIDDDGLFLFAEIQLILLHANRPVFICSPFVTIGYHSMVRGYEVTHASPALNWFALEQEKLIDPYPLCLYSLPNGEKVIVLKHYL